MATKLLTPTLSPRRGARVSGIWRRVVMSTARHGVPWPPDPVRGGRIRIRSILFVVAEVVRRHDPDFAGHHRRLTQAGKPKKVTWALAAPGGGEETVVPGQR